MSRLGRALGEIARKIFEMYPSYLVSSDTETYVNSGDVLTELRNIRKMLTRASGGAANEWSVNVPKLLGLDNGGVIEELEALAMLFKAGVVSVDVNQDDIFPVVVDEYKLLLWESALNPDTSQEGAETTDYSGTMNIPWDWQVCGKYLVAEIKYDNTVRKEILQFTEPAFEGNPIFDSTSSDFYITRAVLNSGTGMFTNFIMYNVPWDMNFYVKLYAYGETPVQSVVPDDISEDTGGGIRPDPLS